jgi:enamine deaminase RidA (YjgF/YER057c/UK114 family)
MNDKPTTPSENHTSDIAATAIPLHPDGWPSPHGYTNGMTAQGRLVFVAGQIGWNPMTMRFESHDFAAQVAQTLQNVVTVLAAGDALPHHLIRMTWFITDKHAYLAARQHIGQTYREIIGRHFPPMSVVVVSALLEDAAQIEIEATALVPLNAP